LALLEKVLSSFLKFLFLGFFLLLMKVILNIPNVYYEEKVCNEFIECLEIYMRYLIEYQKQLGLCYGSNYLERFSSTGKYRNECTGGYVEILK
jgi:hypothetical protein